jgi:hypothetical protein
VADIDLDNGDDRLAVHLGLKARRLMRLHGDGDA